MPFHVKNGSFSLKSPFSLKLWAVEHGAKIQFFKEMTNDLPSLTHKLDLFMFFQSFKDDESFECLIDNIDLAWLTFKNADLAS